MWIVLALGSAFFAGLTSVIAKGGIRKTDAAAATAIRTVVILIFAWIMVFLTGAQSGIGSIGAKSLVFLILSGLSTGVSWLCYFKALQIGDINKVVPVDKSSTVLTVALAIIFFGETENFLFRLIGIVLIGIGTFLMIDKKDTKVKEKHGWFFFAAGSVLFSAATTILGKIGIGNIDSNLGTAIRTTVVLVLSWCMLPVTGKSETLKNINKNELLFICLSGIATGVSWMCYYGALKIGEASVVVPIDKLSILVTILFSRIVFKEKLSVKAFSGLAMIVAGTLAIALAGVIKSVI